MTPNKQNDKVEEIEKEFLRTCVNINGLSLGDMVLHNGEVLKDIPEFTEALSEALTSSYEMGVRDTVGNIGAGLLAQHSPQAVLDAYFDVANKELEKYETDN